VYVAGADAPLLWSKKSRKIRAISTLIYLLHLEREQEHLASGNRNLGNTM
jgi:hypothetical protein